MPKVSIIIPCFNLGQYIDEAVDSVLQQTFHDFEIIIVNDGSSDDYTNKLLDSFNRPKTKVITIANNGLGNSRNVGIKASSGEFILPLDADDIISPTYIEKALDVFTKKPGVKIVYCKAELFDKQNGLWEMPDFDFDLMLQKNLIFCSAFFRRADYNKTKGYATKMSYMGWEDWNFWLSLIELDVEHAEKAAYRIPEVLFYYRIRNVSMIRVLDENKDNILRREIFLDHINLYAKYFENPISLFYRLQRLENNYDKLNRNYIGLLNSRALKLGRILLKPFKKF